MPIFVTTGARGIEHLLAVQLAAIEYSAASTGRGTTVTLKVTVPADPFASRFETRSTASSGPFKSGAIYSTASGYSQEAMTMKFKLDVP